MTILSEAFVELLYRSDHVSSKVNGSSQGLATHTLVHHSADHNRYRAERTTPHPDGQVAAITKPPAQTPMTFP